MNTENRTEIKTEIKEFISISKDVYEASLCELFGYSCICFKIDDLLGETILGSQIFTALELLGYNQSQAPERLVESVYQIVNHHTSKINKPINEINRKKVGKKILKDVMVEINKLKTNPRYYE